MRAPISSIGVWMFSGIAVVMLAISSGWPSDDVKRHALRIGFFTTAFLSMAIMCVQAVADAMRIRRGSREFIDQLQGYFTRIMQDRQGQRKSANSTLWWAYRRILARGWLTYYLPLCVLTVAVAIYQQDALYHALPRDVSIAKVCLPLWAVSALSCAILVGIVGLVFVPAGSLVNAWANALNLGGEKTVVASGVEQTEPGVQQAEQVEENGAIGKFQGEEGSVSGGLGSELGGGTTFGMDGEGDDFFKWSD